MLRRHRHWFNQCVLFLLSCLICLGVGGFFPKVPNLQAGAWAVAAERLVDRGLEDYKVGRFAEAIAQWEKALTQSQSSQDRAILYSNLGQAYRQIGNSERAIQYWESAIRLYREKRSPATNSTLAQLLTEQAQAYSDLGQHQVAVERSQAAVQLAKTINDEPTEAAAQGVLGTAYWAMGEFENAFTAHQQSLAIACSLSNANFTATALNNLGNVFVSRAERFRYQATVSQQEGETTEATDLSRLADRNLQIALAAFQQSAEVSRKVADSTETTALLNLNRLLKEFPQFAPIPIIPELTCRQLNLAALIKSDITPQGVAPTPGKIASSVPNPPPKAEAVLDQNRSQILTRLAAEPDSQDKAFGYINLANQLLQATSAQPQLTPSADPKSLLEKALSVARTVKDKRSESFALGTLGRYYELSQQYQPALELTRQAQFLAQSVNAADSLYRWQWQSGRIFKATGQTQAAIGAYEQAIATLQSIRSDLIIASKDLQFDFQNSIEPVYRELIGLLLASDERATGQTTALAAKPDPDPVAPRQKSLNPSSNSQAAEFQPFQAATNSSNVEKVLDILELFKLAELQDFFGDDCVQAAQEGIATEVKTGSKPGRSPTAIDPQSAVVYSIVLNDRSYEILKLPNGTLKKYPIQLTVDRQSMPATRATLGTRIDRLRALLEKRSTDEYLTEAQIMYNALIRPLESDLQAANPSSLVFISDTVLRKVPMAALHDGQQFLIQKYPIATTPSLTLTSRRPFDRNNLKALVMGLTLEQPPFAALPNVRSEVQEVHHILGGTKLLDQDFTLKSVQDRLKGNRYPIVHIATHGRFGGDAENTYLLTYRDRITLNTLDQVLQTRKTDHPVELLTLSACQTAAGNDRSALGIAGLAVRAGVKSAVATLWFINDEATVPLIEEFYTQLLKPGSTKAEALQQAQVKLIGDLRYNHPAVWSPFVLVGNWM
ncbi:MAG: CHAT domain-containing protein [Leptolyngbyaceae cyanobacterium bins.302]|nr:CHAT domain-containing protein [Leptolyngbyaceae cyanobacterium bins.302]